MEFASVISSRLVEPSQAAALRRDFVTFAGVAGTSGGKEMKRGSEKREIAPITGEIPAATGQRDLLHAIYGQKPKNGGRLGVLQRVIFTLRHGKQSPFLLEPASRHSGTYVHGPHHQPNPVVMWRRSSRAWCPRARKSSPQNLHSASSREFSSNDTYIRGAVMGNPEEIFKTEELYTRSRGNSRSIVLNRNEKGQLLDRATLDWISHCVHSYKTYNKEVMSIMIRNTGSSAFCPGVDIKSLYPDMDAFTSKWQPEARTYFRKVQELAWDLASISYPPTMSVMNGFVGGPGLSFGLNCHYACGTFNTVIALTALKDTPPPPPLNPKTKKPACGFVPYGGASFRYAKLPRKLGFYLALTGVPVSGIDTFFSELVSHFAPENLYDDVIHSLEDTQYRGFSAVRMALCDGLMMDKLIPKEARRAFSFQPHLDAIERCFSQDDIESVLQALDKEKTAWSQETRALILKAAPTSVKVTFEMLKLAESMSIEECLQMENKALLNMMERPDYEAGLRMVLSTDASGKGDDNASATTKTPTWEPPRLEDVPKTTVQQILTEIHEQDDFRVGIVVEDIEGGELKVNTEPKLDYKWLQDGHVEPVEMSNLSEEELFDMGLITDDMMEAVEKYSQDPNTRESLEEGGGGGGGGKKLLSFSISPLVMSAFSPGRPVILPFSLPTY
eukprot:jgi/Bigna1/87008/estExt_fgenesh1_pg.C_160011